MKSQILTLSAEEKTEAGAQVAKQLRMDFGLNGSESIGLFESFPDEIDTKPIIRMLEDSGIRAIYPIWGNGEMRFDEENRTELYLVPGLAFDGDLNRLGRGQGYYDKFMAEAKMKPNPPIFIGIAMDCQVIDQVPVEKHDQKVDVLVTPNYSIGTDL